MVQAMEGAMDGTRYGLGSSRTNVSASYESKEILMVQVMEGAMDGTSDGSRSCRRRYMDQEAVEGAMDGASDGRSDRWYKR
jgi:hypothetical protein